MTGQTRKIRTRGKLIKIGVEKQRCEEGK